MHTKHLCGTADDNKCKFQKETYVSITLWSEWLTVNFV